MKISCWPDNTSKNGKKLYKRMMDVMQLEDVLYANTLEGDLGFIWSVLWANRMAGNKQVWDHFRSLDLPVVVLEVGGISRNTTWRLSANGITRGSIFPAVGFDEARPRKLGMTLKPWHSGDYILICGQNGLSQQWENLPAMGEYYKRTVTEVRKYTDRPIYIRSHPRYKEGLFFNVDYEFFKDLNVTWNVPQIVQNTYDDFDIDQVLAHAHCVISHSSNAGLLGIMAGTPAIVSQASLAYPMGTDKISQIESLPTPDREEWLIDLSHKEWLAEELPSAWHALRGLL